MTAAHFDVLIIGAGLSGIAAGAYLNARCPQKRWAILEARDALGGTWDLFRYPGVRSDSDMFTFGFSFKPWTRGRTYAEGGEILTYLRESADECGVSPHIRYSRRVTAARWSSAEGRWTVEVHNPHTQEAERYTCAFLWGCSGYYRYDAGYTPDFPGADRFQGQVIHPQRWPEGLEVAGKRVVVIGSGATAVTLVPALAERGARVTMLQRTPTWVISQPGEDRVARWLRGRLPAAAVHEVGRWKSVLGGVFFYWLAQQHPRQAERFLLEQLRESLGDSAEVERHFHPDYKPWDQRLCLVPDGDLFQALRSGRAQVVTDHIQTFTEGGIQLRSGQHLDADLIVTATGLQLLWLGGATLEVDGAEIDPAQRMLYRGAMLDEVPNAAVTIGYTNASWTLRAELTCALVCRILNHMDAQGHTQCWPRRRSEQPTEHPILDLKSGYVQRARHLLPKQGGRAPWRVHQNYLRDLWESRGAQDDDGTLELR